MKFATRDKILFAKQPGDIFSMDKDLMRQEYLAYAKLYHPDVSKDSTIFKIISSLYQRGMEMLNRDGESTKEWETKTIFIVDANGRQYRMRYEGKYAFEFGTELVGQYTILYLFEKQYEKYYKNMVQVVPTITYADEHMKDYFSNFVPQIRQHGQTKEGQYYVAIAKDDTEYPLRAMLNLSVFKDGLDSKDIAWMVSRLNNLICFLEFNELVHNGITPDNLFVDPTKHCVCLYGGWWYATKTGEKMLGCTKEVYDVIPKWAKDKHTSTSDTDIQCVKLFIKQHMNIREGYKSELMQYACSPAVRSPSKSSAMFNLSIWNKKVDKAFGKRQFHKMEVNKNEIYN